MLWIIQFVQILQELDSRQMSLVGLTRFRSLPHCQKNKHGLCAKLTIYNRVIECKRGARPFSLKEHEDEMDGGLKEINSLGLRGTYEMIPKREKGEKREEDSLRPMKVGEERGEELQKSRGAVGKKKWRRGVRKESKIIVRRSPSQTKVSREETQEGNIKVEPSECP